MAKHNATRFSNISDEGPRSCWQGHAVEENGPGGGTEGGCEPEKLAGESDSTKATRNKTESTCCAQAAAQKAVDDGADQQVIDELQTTKAGITAQRDSLFKGETLRGLLLSAFAWSTVGTIAGIAAIAAFIAAIIMTFLVGIGLVHRARTRRIISVEALMT